MQVSKWGNGLGVRLPPALVKTLGLKPGDELEVVTATPGRIVVVKDDRRVRAVARMRAHALPIPDDYTFDRDEAHAR